MNVPITQSKEWQKLQEDLGEVSFFEKKNDYQYLAILKNTPIGHYLYLPYGPIFDDKKGFNNAIKSLNELAKQKNAIFIRIEPQNINFPKTKNLKKTKNLSPADTWLLDLTISQEDIIKHFSQGTRTRYNTYHKKGIIVETSKNLDDIKHLVSLQSELFKEKHLAAYTQEYLKKELEQPFATLYLVKYIKDKDESRTKASGEPKDYPEDGQVLAASLFFDSNGTRYYMQSAADGKFKRLPSTVALLTRAIFDAKERGLKAFDFWGIAPEGAGKDHPWAGFTEFKKSFGGQSVHYAGTYDLILKPVKYRLYQIFRKINRWARK